MSQAVTAENLSARGRLWLTVTWASFLTASLATMVFFAFVDPTPIVALLTPTAAIPTRTALYSVGFFFFWAICALAASLTAWLMSEPSDDITTVNDRH